MEPGTTQKIGFIGLGIMGAPMAGHSALVMALEAMADFCAAPQPSSHRTSP